MAQHEQVETSPATGTLRVAAVGDLLLTAGPLDAPSPQQRLAGLRSLLGGADVAFANLEGTLAGDGKTVETEPRVVCPDGTPEAIAVAGVNVVTLANNHAFDCLAAGFRRTREAVERAGLVHFGAGETLDEATAAAIIERNGLRLAFLAGVAGRSGPSALAAADRPGVAPLDMDRLTHQVRQLATQVNHVFVSLHWGDERFSVPAPAQIAQAHALVDAGASAVLGHHPHVLQGMETYRGAPIIYSLGNFIADDVHWTDGDVMRWNRTERTGCILWLHLDPWCVVSARQQLTFDDGLTVRALTAAGPQRRLRRLNRRVARGVRPWRYRREHLWVRTIRPTIAHLRWRRLRRLRWRNVRNAWRALRGTFTADKR